MQAHRFEIWLVYIPMMPIFGIAVPAEAGDLGAAWEKVNVVVWAVGERLAADRKCACWDAGPSRLAHVLPDCSISSYLKM